MHINFFHNIFRLTDNLYTDVSVQFRTNRRFKLIKPLFKVWPKRPNCPKHCLQLHSLQINVLQSNINLHGFESLVVVCLTNDDKKTCQ